MSKLSYKSDFNYQMILHNLLSRANYVISHVGVLLNMDLVVLGPHYTLEAAHLRFPC